MQPLSAADSISPAFHRTRLQLFAPFRIGRSWKLAASAYLALFSAFFFPGPLLLLAVPWQQLALSRPMVALVLGGTAIYTLVLFGFFYLGIRFELTVFGLAGTGGHLMAPLWRANRPRTWPWLLLKAAPGTVLTVLAVPLLHHMAHAAQALFRSMPPQAHSGAVDPATNAWVMGFMTQMMGVYGLVAAGVVLLFLSSSLLHDLVLPFYLLESATVSAALRSGVAFCRRQPGEVAVYVLLKVLLAAMGFVAQYLVALVLLLPAMLVVFLLLLLAAALHSALSVTAATVFLIVGGAFLYGLLIAYQFYTQLLTIGTLSLFLEHFGLVFVGSRYPPLGALLDASPLHMQAAVAVSIPPPATPPPPFYSAGVS